MSRGAGLRYWADLIYEYAICWSLCITQYASAHRRALIASCTRRVTAKVRSFRYRLRSSSGYLWRVIGFWYHRECAALVALFRPPTQTQHLLPQTARTACSFYFRHGFTLPHKTLPRRSHPSVLSRCYFSRSSAYITTRLSGQKASMPRPIFAGRFIDYHFAFRRAFSMILGPF